MLQSWDGSISPLLCARRGAGKAASPQLSACGNASLGGFGIDRLLLLCCCILSKKNQQKTPKHKWASDKPSVVLVEQECCVLVSIAVAPAASRCVGLSSQQLIIVREVCGKNNRMFLQGHPRIFWPGCQAQLLLTAQPSPLSQPAEMEL